jgi:dTDP-4-dehydrorhamnose 3,5-epimerase
MAPTMAEEPVVEGVRLFPLKRLDDERGWFVELARASALMKSPLQANLSFSRRGVIRGLHYHERGQDDLFVCLSGTARVVVLDRESGNALSLDIGEANQVALYVPGHHAHGFEALADVLMLYFVTQEYDADQPDEQVIPWNDLRVRHLWSTQSPILSGRDATVVVS